jgi:hypothetical protein
MTAWEITYVVSLLISRVLFLKPSIKDSPTKNGRKILINNL